MSADRPDYSKLLEEHPQLSREEAGVAHRIERFYLPLFVDFGRRHGIELGRMRVLDSGCGNGLSVGLLAAAGMRAYGVDAWPLRVEQWRHERLLGGGGGLLADATRLPYADRSFDIVLSCGLLEHIGVIESWEPSYAVAPAADQAAARRRFFAECLRVLKRPGVLFVDHPNGRFPFDFWHDNTVRPGRLHSPWEPFLPSFAEVRALARTAGFDGEIEALSPADRFVFRQVGRRWWGRALAAPTEAWLRVMRFPPLRFLAASPLNPYLVVRLEVS